MSITVPGKRRGLHRLPRRLRVEIQPRTVGFQVPFDLIVRSQSSFICVIFVSSFVSYLPDKLKVRGKRRGYGVWCLEAER